MRPKAISYSSLISNGGILDVLTGKTGLKKVNIPTEAQWEYACRAGCVRGLNSGRDVSVANMMEVGRCEETGGDGKGGTEYNDASTIVGMYMPNAWGIYDMHGNAGEWVLDLYKEDLGTNDVVDPLITTGKRIVRGLMTGCYYSYNTGAYMNECRSASRNVPNDDSSYGYWSGQWDDSAHRGPYGIRLITIE
jgi:formylglycine-generating enzyme required for sulfatase activity